MMQQKLTEALEAANDAYRLNPSPETRLARDEASRNLAPYLKAPRYGSRAGKLQQAMERSR